MARLHVNNKCWRVLTLHALTEIHRILQTEENILQLVVKH